MKYIIFHQFVKSEKFSPTNRKHGITLEGGDVFYFTKGRENFQLINYTNIFIYLIKIAHTHIYVYRLIPI